MYTYEKFNFRPFPFLLLTLGIVFTFMAWYLEAGIFGTLGALLFISFKGFNVDTKTYKIRQFDRFLWFYLGAWKPFSKPLYVAVVSIKLGVNRTSPSPIIAPAGKSISTYKMNLIVEGKERFIPLLRGKKDLLLKEGLIIARMLSIKLLDYTNSEKNWIT